MKVLQRLIDMTPLIGILIGLLAGSTITGGVLFKIAIDKQGQSNEKVISTITEAATIDNVANAFVVT